ncbi:unnamed protein product [Arabis nemorensis]|uniref:RRM domain-containing protein n=1 Tax=Arabis nemorensis TaxID=586526 RepID=A0A565CS91_9BRAS|nr:unnamed protein product [Arabis nemorensis]
MAESVGGGGVRLHVGGLGESVGKDDLLKIFSPMGSVDSVEFVRTKGRSFAYIDFSPSSDNSLTKLFSMYNGCVWKGGRLRLEKAKEHYLARLKREWEESSSTSDDTVVQAPDNSTPPPTHLNIFVPKLRKVKAMPLSGTGKHKYSFQRVPVPSLLPKSFCDCEEHSTSLTPRENHVRDLEALSAGINEEEVNIMNSVMSKLFEKNNLSKSEQVPDQKLAEKNDLPKSEQVPEDEEDSEIEEDEDNLIINVVSNGNDMMNSELDILSRKRKSILNETTASGEGYTEGRKESHIHPSKKRQTEGSSGRQESSQAIREKKKPSEVDPDKSSDEPSRMSGVKRSNDNIAWSQKSSWKALMANGNSGNFSVTSVLPDVGSSDAVQHASSNTDTAQRTAKTKIKKTKSKRLTSTIMEGNLPVVDDIERNDATATDDVGSDHSEDTGTDTCVEAEPLEPVSSTEGDSENDNLNVEEDENVAEDFNAEKESLVLEDNVGHDEVDNEETRKGPLEACSKSTGGSSWLQRASWTQLVSERDTSFSLTQLFPDSSSDKCEAAGAVNNADGQYSNSNQSESGMKQRDYTSSSNGVEAAGVHVDSTPVRSLEETRQSLKAKNVSEGSRLSVKKPIRRVIGSGETCTFMRSSTSLNEWKKAKQALSEPRRRNKGKEELSEPSSRKKR